MAVPAVLFFGCAGSAFAQHLGQGMDDGLPAWRIVLTLLFCLAVAIAAALVLKRRMGGGLVFRSRTSQRLQMVECLRMGSQVTLCIVACDGEDLLMSVSQDGASLVRSLRPSSGAPQAIEQP